MWWEDDTDCRQQCKQFRRLHRADEYAETMGARAHGAGKETGAEMVLH